MTDNWSQGVRLGERSLTLLQVFQTHPVDVRPQIQQLAQTVVGVAVEQASTEAKVSLLCQRSKGRACARLLEFAATVVADVHVTMLEDFDEACDKRQRIFRASG